MIVNPSWTQTFDEQPNAAQTFQQQLPPVAAIKECFEGDSNPGYATSNHTSEVSSTFHIPPTPPLPPSLLPTSARPEPSTSLNSGEHLNGNISVEPTLSETVSKLLGKHVPDNTIRATATAFNEFTEFVIDAFNLWILSKKEVLQEKRTPPWKRKSLLEEAVGLVSIIYFAPKMG
ncbi:hypothetical protein FGB62_213g010 [Gracilaria domingensis]|nr:hypothetical protein FGB62_213g010 [Gracilaria domingensis]